MFQIWKDINKQT